MISLKQNKQLRLGFSLMEILIVLTIVGVLIAVVLGAKRTITARMNKTATQTTLRELASGIDNYKLDIGDLPQKLNDLIKKPSGENAAKKWDGPYYGKKGITTIPEDPWGNDYKYKITKGGKHPYELYSEGAGEDSPKIDYWDL